MSSCGHLLCELIDSTCSLALHRSRGCRPNLHDRAVTEETLAEVRALLAAIDPAAPTEATRAAAVRLAQIIRKEALDDRPLLAYARIDEPELVPALERLTSRRASARRDR